MMMMMMMIFYFNFRNCVGSFDSMSHETCEPVCGMYGERRHAYWVLLGNMKERAHLEELGVLERYNIKNESRRNRMRWRGPD